MTRVLSLAPSPDFICNILFVLFVPKKNKKGTTMWVPVKSNPDLLIVFNSRNNYTLANFQSASPTIDWSAYILKHHNWPKCSPKSITQNGSFAKWLGNIDAGTQTKGGIIISMYNPKDKFSQAHKEDFVARTLRQLAACREEPLNARALQGSTSG
ncbi:hypothetical protein PCASD_11553 [Puccinia coronata f. sp. avenae]|uniref:Uncharacterized protein n=1 Tax=Puccinia coronata f. sp. avenae TaxID=200324 RepID=A0A2N5TFY7_9BASI|nr:hypothetical protein PCASD_11553 [Puccinia coronata f. sp. avenae]